MTALIIGGAASGKSEYAESLLEGAENKFYIATMQPFGDDASARIARHRTLRASKGFKTLERFTALGAMTDAELPEGCAVLLECLGNLAANELFAPQGAGEKAEIAILDGIAHLMHRSRHLVVVTNGIFADGVTYDAETTRYLSLLGRCNAQIAARFDRVVEVVCGIPILLKGESV